MNKAAFLSALLLTPACAGPREAPPIFAAGGDVPADWAAAPGRGGDVRNAWIADFNDPVLAALVEEAVANNPDLAAAEARLMRARALARQSRSSLFPSLDISAGVSQSDGIEQGTEHSVSLSVGASASWEVDLWGRVRSGARRGKFEAISAAADREGAERLLAAAVAEGYFLAIGARRQAEVSAETYDRLDKTLGFVTVQYERGLRSGQDIALIRADVKTTEAALAGARGATRDALRSLEVLLGRYPAAELGLADFPAHPNAVPGGTPAQILERRPDIASAAARVTAAQAALSGARAERLPRISLTGTIESIVSEPDALLSPATIVWRAAGGLVAPIFQGGAIGARIDAANATLDEAVAFYRVTALDAFREVEGLLDREAVLREREAALAAAREQAGLALQYVQFRYENGDASLLDVLNIQQRVSSLESAYVALRTDRLTQYARLALALGGDWTDKNMKLSAAITTIEN